ncbi:hypothetical protein [Pseudomonas sp. MWU13-3659]|uniref:hypothetical protein n=1 Tax=Pseudomonas sp. MWU13-3659 TaxID=2986964 RepID=UPI0020757740|nr:hypothetical protein [Pseudomonas sp. MWU13-3659]
MEVSDRHGLAEPKIEYLGVGGWLVHWRGEGLLLAPSFSNPATLGLRGVPPLGVHADDAKIDKYMAPLHAEDVTMLLVGHAHYDHLLDVIRVMQVHTPKATVYGSETVGHILQVAIPRARIVEPERADIAYQKDPSYRGTWFYSQPASVGKVMKVRDGNSTDLEGNRPTGKIRAMPLNSMHAGHIFRVNLIPGAYDHDLDALPGGVLDWKLGHHTLAWLIDLLGDDGKPVYRIHYQDSAAEPPFGFPPVIADSKAVDIEILCAGDWTQVSYYPDGLLRVTKPRLVLVGHWENFFGNDLERPPRTIPLQNPKPMVERIKAALPDAEVVVPKPLSEWPLPTPN